MKEIMSFIRPAKVNATKKALADAGFPAFLCRACLGRGKKALDPAALKLVLESGGLPVSAEGEALTEALRLIPKRFFTVFVEDGDADEAIKTIIKANRTGNPGDGRIFVLPTLESYGVRTGEPGL
ncbi:MAG: P-II family nitrogen regulator [Oscillospiraceae bacterium]|jgi:nitrogen regulatory protein PII 2|nr:P-II family nitrogen regulator [Oscillospiraceae bacterium]